MKAKSSHLFRYFYLKSDDVEIVSLRYHRSAKENEALLPSPCNSDDPEGLAFENYWKLYFKSSF